MLLTLLDVPDVDSVGGVRFAIGGHYVVRRPLMTLKEAIIRDVLLVIILEWVRKSFSC